MRKIVTLTIKKIRSHRRLSYFLFILLSVLWTTSVSSCKTKEGCGLEEKYNNVDLESSKRGKSNLFSDKQQRRMKKNK